MLKKIIFSLTFILAAVLFASLTINELISAPSKNKYEKTDYKPEISDIFISSLFVKNIGQTSQEVQYITKEGLSTIWLLRDGFVFRRNSIADNLRFRSADEGQALKKEIPDEIAIVRFLSINKDVQLLPISKKEYTANYFLGNEPDKWFIDVPSSEAVLYKDIYPNIDMKAYLEEGQFEFDFVVRAGGNPQDIRFNLENIIPDGIADANTVTYLLKKPNAFQVINDKIVKVQVEFRRIKPNTWGFDAGKYNHDIELIIDPLIFDYGSYLGGSNNDWILAAAVDSEGALYVCGYTGSIDFPLENPIQEQKNQNFDIFITKFSRTGRFIEYSTYLGGSSYDYPYDMDIDSEGNAYITGETGSSDFPLKNPFQSIITGPGGDIFLTKISPSGDSLIYSTYIGGSTCTDTAFSIKVDTDSNVYVGGFTCSRDFPTHNGYQNNWQGDYDGFILKMNSDGDSLLFSTYLGGKGWDCVYGISISNDGFIYITGTTSSSDFPVLKAIQAGYAGGGDAFLSCFQSGTGLLEWSTYLGGSGGEHYTKIGISFDRYLYIAGQTNSTDFPVINPLQSNLKGGLDAFIMKVDLYKDPLQLLSSTYFGGSGSEENRTLEIAPVGDVVLAGYTPSYDFPVYNSIQQQYNGGMWDGFITCLSPNLDKIIFSSYVGGNDIDFLFDCDVDEYGVIYLCGTTKSRNIPIKNAYQKLHAGAWYDGYTSRLRFQQEQNMAPVACIKADRQGGLPNAEIGFSSAESYDSDGDIKTREWSTSKGDLSYNEYDKFVFPSAGVYTVELMVRDNDGEWSAPADTQIEIFESSALSAEVYFKDTAIKARGRESTTVYAKVNKIDSQGNIIHPLEFNIGLDFKAETALFFNDLYFDPETSIYSRTLISGEPGGETIKAVVDGIELGMCHIEFTWPEPPIALQLNYQIERSLFRGAFTGSLTWEENPDCLYAPAKYKVYYSGNGIDFTAVEEIQAPHHGYHFEGLSVKSSHFFSVSKVDIEGDESSLSEIIELKLPYQ